MGWCFVFIIACCSYIIFLCAYDHHRLHDDDDDYDCGLTWQRSTGRHHSRPSASWKSAKFAGWLPPENLPEHCNQDDDHDDDIEEPVVVCRLSSRGCSLCPAPLSGTDATQSIIVINWTHNDDHVVFIAFSWIHIPSPQKSTVAIPAWKISKKRLWSVTFPR